MNASTELLPLVEIVVPKPGRPNLVENIETALANPARTLREYLFTSGIRGHFDRIFRDLAEGRGGGYWVQAEYGGGKTHFLSTLLCLTTSLAGLSQEQTWANVEGPDLQENWAPALAGRSLLGAHLSLMGTTATVGTQQPRLIDLIDGAIVQALQRAGYGDPGLGVGEEVISWFSGLEPGVRSSVEAEFQSRTGMRVDAHKAEYEMPARTAQALLESAAALGFRPNLQLDVQQHFSRVLQTIKQLGFDGLVLVIDEYFSREGALTDAQKVEDGSIIETVGFRMGREQRYPIHLVMASQSEMPAKLSERMDPVVLLRDEEKEYSQIVCKRIMDLRDAVNEQAFLYHTHFAKHFQFLRNTTEEETKGIFPFQRAVFRFLRDLVNTDRVHLPSTRFAIGVAYDAITTESALNSRRLLTRSDLLVGRLERDLLSAPETAGGAGALRQAREFVDSAEWQVAYFKDMAHRIISHLFLDSVIGGQGQSIDQIVEGTLIQDEKGMLLPKQVAQAVLNQLKNCEQIESKGDSWRFSTRVTEGEQFETIFQRERRKVSKTDARIEAKWAELLTANVGATGGVPTFLSQVVTRLPITVQYNGLEYPAEAVSASTNLAARLQPLERLTQSQRAKVVVALHHLDTAPLLTDAALAVVAPGDLSEPAIDELRGLLSCDDISEEYRSRPELGADRVLAAAELKARELTKAIVNRQKETYRDGEIYTKDGLALNPKQLFRDNLSTGLQLIAIQLVHHAYQDAKTVLNMTAPRRSSLAPADSQKVFDAIFGDLTEPRTAGAAQAFGPLLGLSTPKEPLRLVAGAGPGPDAIAGFIDATPNCAQADLYNRFCNEPYGLPADVVDLLTLACVALSKPYPIELRPPAGVPIPARDRGSISGPIRAGQLRRIQWPKGLKGFTLAQSRETTWNDFAPVAQALDPDRFSLTADQREIESQEKALLDRLRGLSSQISQTIGSLTAIAGALGTPRAAGDFPQVGRLRGLADLGTDYSRDSALKYASETWADGNYSGIKADLERLNSLTGLAGEAPALLGRLAWFRQLVAAAPAALETEIALAEPLVTFDALTAGPGQLAMARQHLEQLWNLFLAKFRAEHDSHIAWVGAQREALQRAQGRLVTLKRLNRLRELGPPELPEAEGDLALAHSSLTPCNKPEPLDVGNGRSCMSCKYTFGDNASRQPLGENAERAIVGAIERRARFLSQDLIAQVITTAADADLVAVLAAAQAGQFKKIIDDDLLTDELVRRLGAILAKARQQTVASTRPLDYVEEHPYVTLKDLDGWLLGLRAHLEAGLQEAKKANPGKEITLFLKLSDE